MYCVVSCICVCVFVCDTGRVTVEGAQASLPGGHAPQASPPLSPRAALLRATTPHSTSKERLLRARGGGGIEHGKGGALPSLVPRTCKLCAHVVVVDTSVWSSGSAKWF